MMKRRTLLLVAAATAMARPAQADPPVASYIFPAGGQRGTTVAVKVGGLNLHSKASFEMLGPGVEVSPEIRRVETLWFEGPLLPLPDSQQAEDYPKDYAGRVTIAGDAATGPRAWRLWTSEGTTGSPKTPGVLPFVVGDLPEVAEREVEGDPLPEPVVLPLTINGRIFPREDVDLWSFPLRAGEVLTATVDAGRLGSPLDPWLEALDADGRRIAEAAPAPGSDARLAFAAPADGTYTVKIHDVNVKGAQSYVYRLTLTTGASVARVFPLGGRRGVEVAFAAEGLGLPVKLRPVTLPSEDAGRGPQASIVRFEGGGSATVEVDDLPEVMESGSTDSAPRPTRLEVPGVGNGRIAREGEVDLWTIALSKGKEYVFDLRAARLGSRLDAILSVTDPNGKELAHADGGTANGGDPRLTFGPPADGDYLLRVKDRFRSRGGPDWAYRLRATGTPAADFRLNLTADTLSVPRGGEARIKVEAERIGGFKGPITLKLEGMQEGVSAANTVIGPNAGNVEIRFQSDPRAPIRSSRITISGTAEVEGKPVERVAARRGLVALPDIESLRLAVALSAPFKIGGPTDYSWAHRGSVHRRHYRIERNGFAGPIEVELADRQARHLQGVSGPLVIVPDGVEEFDYPVTLPPWMEIGRTSRTVVMATGVIREPDGSEHEVSFSSTRNEVQAVSVIEPGLLGLEARLTSLAVAPEKTLEVAIRLSRGKGVAGPVRVELVAPGRVRGLSADPLVLVAGQDEGIVRIHCGSSVECPRIAQVLLLARSVDLVDPVTAETLVTLVSDGSTGRGD